MANPPGSLITYFTLIESRHVASSSDATLLQRGKFEHLELIKNELNQANKLRILTKLLICARTGYQAGATTGARS